MKTCVIKIDREKPDTEKLIKAAEVLREGGVVVLPTDTVYGIAANAFDLKAQRQIYKLKGRSYRKPLVVMAPDAASLEFIAEIPSQARKLMKKYWPGPLTLVLPATPCGSMLMGGRKDLGVRVPDDAVVLKLMGLCGFPLATTSANPSSHDSAKDGKQAIKYFNNKVDVIIDGGCCTTMKESSVLDMIHFPYVVLREGCISKKKLLECLE